MKDVVKATLEILNESSPYLLLGFALAGVLHVVLTRFPRVTAQITGNGTRPVFMAALIGAPMPLCSCSVLPAAMALRRQGASKGATASFLVSVPETDVVSVFLTLALIGPFVAIYRPIAAIVGALATGLFVQWLERRKARAVSSTPALDPSCCHVPENSEQTVRTVTRPWWTRAFGYGFIEIFDDIIPQLLLGIVLAGIIGAWLPTIDPRAVQGGSLLSYVVMVAIAAPLYVCATASTPIAAGLIAGGVSPGAAMVFLLAGPATNLGSLVVLRSEFGTRILAGYLAAIIATSVALGALLDWLIGSARLGTAVVVPHAHAASPFQIACTGALLIWILVSVHRSRLLPRIRAGLARTAGRLLVR
jgi:uncharacterized protein